MHVCSGLPARVPSMSQSTVRDEVESWFKNETEVVRPRGASTIMFDGKFDQLNFAPTNWPIWRHHSRLPSTDHMLSSIKQCKDRWRNCLKPPCNSSLQAMLTGRFIYHNNKAEDTGLASEEYTMTLLAQPHIDCPERKRREVLQMRDAMQYLLCVQQTRLQQKQAPAESILLTVDTVLEAHRLLTLGLMSRPGLLREEEAFGGAPGGGRFYYDPPQLLAGNLNAVIELYNALLAGLLDDWSAVYTKPKLYNLASFLYVQFATVHPFDDGNGRLARLLVNFVLGAISPFPVPLHIDEIRSPGRYVQALMSSRDLSNPRLTRIRSPCDMAALMIEAAWQSWHDALGHLLRDCS